MSRFNGLELIKRIKSSNPNVITIPMSGYNFDLVDNGTFLFTRTNDNTSILLALLVSIELEYSCR
ncbi:MAG: hypothetical protein E6L04_08755 [Thaumarchaeota archaeon]|nr:MAG: hypothetical protein E6L04_08755 [Nitrososphaerota archaeon]